MLLVVITFLLVAVGVVSYLWGAWRLSRYAARISSGLGISVFLFPPVAFWFSFFKLEQDGKEMPTTMWAFGMVSTLILIIVFWAPISLVLQGRFDELQQPVNVGQAAINKFGKKATGGGATAPDTTKPTPTPAPTTATNGATAKPAATNGAAPAAGTTTAKPAATNGAAPAKAPDKPAKAPAKQ